MKVKITFIGFNFLEAAIRIELMNKAFAVLHNDIPLKPIAPHLRRFVGNNTNLMLNETIEVKHKGNNKGNYETRRNKLTTELFLSDET